MHNHGNVQAILREKKCVICKDEVDKGLILYTLESRNDVSKGQKINNCNDASSFNTDQELYGHNENQTENNQYQTINEKLKSTTITLRNDEGEDIKDIKTHFQLKVNL